MKWLSIILSSLIILTVLTCISPAVSSYEGTGGCRDTGPFGAEAGNCAPRTQYSMVFPVIRTVTCSMWHNPGCAVDTFLPGWSDGLMNGWNVFILIVLALLSVFAGYSIGHRQRYQAN